MAGANLKTEGKLKRDLARISHEFHFVRNVE